MNLEARMTQLETIVTAHLEKSDAIWTALGNNTNDLTWLKKSFWVLAGAGVTFNVTLITGLIMWLVHR